MDAAIELPLTGSLQLFVGPKSVSKDFMPSNKFLSLLATGYTEKQISLIVSGPYEINMCSSVPAIAPMVTQSLDEAIARFQTNEPEEKEKPKEDEVKVEEPEKKSEPKPKAATKKATGKK